MFSEKEEREVTFGEHIALFLPHEVLSRLNLQFEASLCQ